MAFVTNKIEGISERVNKEYTMEEFSRDNNDVNLALTDSSNLFLDRQLVD